MRYLILMFCLLFPIGSIADTYGIADFTRSDYMPRDKLLEHWIMDAGTMGDLTGGLGDFETGSASGGCAYCPSGLTCTCAGTAVMLQQTTDIYKNNSSIELSSGDSYASVGFVIPTIEPNTSYMFRAHSIGSGGETINIRLSGGGEYYNFLTDQWQAGATFATIAAIASWRTDYISIRNGPNAKTNYLFEIYNGAIAETFYLDDFQIHELHHVGPTGQMGRTLAPFVTSDPRFGNSEVLLPRVGSGPAGWWGTEFDGVDDGMSYPDTGDVFDPCIEGKECQFSVGCRAITDSVITTGLLLSKAGSVNISWMLRQNTSNGLLYISDNGIGGVGHESSVSIATCFGVNSLSSVIGTYIGVADGSGSLSIYCNNISPTSITNADAPIFNSTDGISTGQDYAGGWGRFDGSIGECSFWNKSLTATEASKYLNPYFPASSISDGFYVTTCAQAASHATCSSQKCREGTPNACQAEGTGTMAIFDQGTELVPYNSFETVVGDDSAPTFTGWTSAAIPGDGTAKVTAYRDETKHGNVSARIKVTGSTSYAYVTQCLPLVASTNYYWSASVKPLTSNSGFSFLSYMYDGAGCTGVTLGAANVDKPLSGNWTEYGTTFTTPVGTLSGYTFLIVNSTTYPNSEWLIDSVSVKAGSYRTPWVHNSGAGSTVYSARNYQLHNPLADYDQANSRYAYAGGFCVGGWVFSDWAGDDSSDHTIVFVPATAGILNRWYYAKSAGNSLTFAVIDSAGSTRYTSLVANGTNWTANNWKYVEGCYNGITNVISRHYNVSNSTWYSGAAGGDVLIGQNGQNSVLYLGSFGGIEFLKGFISKFFIVEYNAAYSMTNFDSGKPPINGRPY